MKVMVTGASGFVGRHVVPVLLSRGHQVVVVTRNAANARDHGWFEEVQCVESDVHLLDAELLRRAHFPEAVVHLAWPGLPNYGALEHLESTLPAQVAFLGSLVSGGIGQVLVSGTCFEYGMQSGSLSEDTPTQPANPYALAKDGLRRYLEQLQRVRPFILQWVRLFYTYGPGQNPASLMAQLDRAIDAGAAEFDMSGGEQLRDYLPIDEVATRIVTVLEHQELQGPVNICSGEPISVRRLVERHVAARAATIRLNLGRLPYSPFEPMAFWGDPRKLRDATEKAP